MENAFVAEIFANFRKECVCVLLSVYMQYLRASQEGYPHEDLHERIHFQAFVCKKDMN